MKWTQSNPGNVLSNAQHWQSDINIIHSLAFISTAKYSIVTDGMFTNFKFL